MCCRNYILETWSCLKTRNFVRAKVVARMKRKQAKLSNFLAPDGPKVHAGEPKPEPARTSWIDPVVKDDFGTGSAKRRTLPTSILKPSINLGYSGYTNSSASKTVSTFRPPERIGDKGYLAENPAGGTDNDVKSGKRKPASSSSSSDEITLSASQKKVIDAIIARRSVFFTGAAGTGKSYVLKVIREVLESLGLSDKVTFTAPTGVAACNIRGLTIHAWAGVGMASEPKDQLAAMVGRSRAAAQRWKECEILVIDEISMLSAELFDKLSFIGSRVRNDPRPFGGLQLVLCGDFYQLPPIGVGKNAHFCFEAKAWEEIFGGREDGCVMLDKVFRQQNDTVFLGILNDLRMGVVTPQAQRVLGAKVQESYRRDREAQLALSDKATGGSNAGEPDSKAEMEIKQEGSAGRDITKAAPSYKKGFAVPSKEKAIAVRPTKLFSTNKDVDEYNLTELQKLGEEDPDSEVYRYEAIDEGRDPYLQQLRQGTKAPAILELRVGAQVMLLKNVSTVRGLVNGARGTVVGFEKSQNRTANTPYIPVVKFQAYLGSSMHEETISVDQETWDIKQGERVLASRVQIPLMLAWAISIHKSQGMTIPLLEVSFNRIFEYGQGYVALSRATCLEGLTLRSFQTSSIKAHTKVSEFYNKITSTATAHTNSNPGAEDREGKSNGAGQGIEITARVSELAKAFVREVPVQDTSDEWIDARSGKTGTGAGGSISDLRKVVSTYKANVQSIDLGGDETEGEDDDVNPYKLHLARGGSGSSGSGGSGGVSKIGAADGDETEGDDELAYCTAPSGKGSTTSAASLTAPTSSGIGKSDLGNPTSAGTTGNKFSQFSLPSASANDWLDDELTEAQRAAARETYARQAALAAARNPPGATFTAGVGTSGAAPAVGPFSSQVALTPAVAKVPALSRPSTASPTVPIGDTLPVVPAVTWQNASVMVSGPAPTALPPRLAGPFSPPAHTDAGGAGAAAEAPVAAGVPPSLLQILQSPPVGMGSSSVANARGAALHRASVGTGGATVSASGSSLQPGSGSALTTSAETSQGGGGGGGAGLSDDVKRRIEQNRIAALERLQESRRRREEETNRMLQQYNI